MRCPRCQQDNPAGARFCNGCGARFQLARPSCGHVNPPGSRFCNECGTKVSEQTAAVAQPRFSSPESYTPKHLAERILTSRAALEGERKHVTVLFADLKGSMELLADRDPEEARKLLDPVLELMMEAVHRYEGTVNQVMGDGIMALFGAPLAHEDHAVRACYAALSMQESVKRYAEEARRAHGVNVQIRVGLNSGEVVVRAIGSDLRVDYTAVGQTTHLAARMEQLASPGSILITHSTLEFAGGYVSVRSLGPVPVKGLTDPVEVLELQGASLARTRLQAAAARGLTRFVGRRDEIEQLRRALENAVRGQGTVVAVVGEPGVGKSRLYYEFSHSHRTQGCLVLESSAVSYGQATPYLSVTELLKTYFQIAPRDDARTVREKVTGKLLALDWSLEGDLSALLALLDVTVPDSEWQELEPPQRRHRIHEAIARLLLRESAVQPLVLVFEDLHWIDSETQACLDRLVEGISAAPILLLVNHRPEYRHGWHSKTYCTQLRIEPLPPESAEGILEALLGSDQSLLSLKQLLIERAQGNPFFLEESVRAAVETKLVDGTRAAYRLTRPLEGVQTPATVQAMLGARIDRLSPSHKQLLGVAAVIGKDVPVALLDAVVEWPEPELHEALAQLQASEFLREGRLFPEPEYTFYHALTHEVAYGGLLKERRRTLHARILDAIERLHCPAEHVDRLAHHAVEGEVWDKAVDYLRKAGERAIARSAYREAVACFERGLGALAHLPESRETKTQAIDLRLDLRALVHLGQYSRILDYLREAAVLARELEDRHRLGAVIVDMCARLRNLGDHGRAIETGEQALALAAEVGDLALDAQANYRAGQAYFAIGDFGRAIDLLRRTVEALEAMRSGEDSGLPRYFGAWSHAWLALALAGLGQFAAGIWHGHQAIRIAELANHPHSLNEAQAALGGVYLAQGQFDRAIAFFEPGVERTRAWRLENSNMLSGLGYARALSGRLVEALPFLEQAAQAHAPVSAMGVGQSIHLTRLGHAYLLAGRIDDAITLSRRALDHSLKLKERANQAWALWLCAVVAGKDNAFHMKNADDHYRQSIALASELGMRPLIAHCQFGLGKLYRCAGELKQGQEHLGIATTMYREMDMRFYLEQAEAELKGLG